MSDRGLVGDVGQLLWLGFDGTQAPGTLLSAVAEGRAGAVILFRRNLVFDGALVDIDHVVALNRTLHGAAGDQPLWIAVDQEGGRVQRIKAPATVWPPMLSFDALDSRRAVGLAERVGRALGRELAALGFDINFAPVLDVHTNPANPIIGDRAFATMPKLAADRALAFAQGLMDGGILPCGKHFPGHGDTCEDSHLALPRVDHDRDRLRDVELAPFRRAAADGLPMIMTAHVVFAAIDDSRPATLSRAVIQQVLRDELGFRGLVISDDLDMQAVAGRYGAGDAAVAAIDAGCDALLLCRDQETQAAVFEALVRAGESSPAMRQRLAESAARVRSLKERSRPAEVGLEHVGHHDHRRLAEELAGA